VQISEIKQDSWFRNALVLAEISYVFVISAFTLKLFGHCSSLVFFLQVIIERYSRTDLPEMQKKK
jgi:hypothetical protein